MKQIQYASIFILLFMMLSTPLIMAKEINATMRGKALAKKSSAKAPAKISSAAVKWEETFESPAPPDDWLIIDADGSNSAFAYAELISFTSGDTVRPQAGANFWFSSWQRANSSGLIDEWLISPQIPTAIESGDSLHFYAGAIDQGFDDSLKVWVSTTDNNPVNFTEIAYFKVDGPVGTFKKYSFDLSAFAGSQIFVAVNYYIVSGGQFGSHSDNVWIDHFVVTGTIIAQPQEFAAYLNAGQETAEVNSNGSGGGRFILNEDSTEVSYEFTVRDLTGSVITAAHIHIGAPGEDGPPVRTLFSGADTTDTDLTYSGIWTTTDAEPLTANLVNELIAGNLYVNVHTDSFGPGEVRGQIVAPEQPAKLLLSEFAVTPTDAEMIEIYNPGSSAIDLTNYYLTDATFQNGGTFYYQIVNGPEEGGGGGFGDFHARFPEGASIAAGEYQTIALGGDSAFAANYGVDPTYELFEDGSNNPNDRPNMREARNGLVDGQGGLTDGDEVIILHYWDSLSDLVVDLDYVIYDDSSPANNEQVDKTGVRIDGPDADTDSSDYLADTPINEQIPAPTATASTTSQRIDFSEGNQIALGGNGVTGGDETSENLNITWTDAFEPTPNGPIPVIALNPPRPLDAEGFFDRVKLRWSSPLPSGELGYDDGSAETAFGVGGGSGEFAVRFTPNIYPTTLLGIKVYWVNSAGAANDVQYSVWVNPNGGDAPPATQVLNNTSHTVTNRNAFEAIDISGQGIQVDAGDFYLSLVQPTATNYGIGLDQNGINGSRSIISFDGGITWFKLDQNGFPDNIMVRALVREGSGPNAKVAELTPTRSFKEPAPYAGYLDAKKVYYHEKSLEAIPITRTTIAKDSPAQIEALNGYNIFRTTDGINFDPVASVNAPDTTFSDLTVEFGTVYGYLVTAVYDEGESGPTNLAVDITVGVEDSIVNSETNGYLTSVSNEGNIGYLNGFPGGEGVTGSGFQFNPKDASGDRLFEGSIMIGRNPSSVSDAARDANGNFDADFRAFIDLIPVPNNFDATVFGTGFIDIDAENDMGIFARQLSISADTLGASNIIGFQYDLFNLRTDSTLENVHLGGFFDWDVDRPTGFEDRGQVIVDSLNQVPFVNNNKPFPIEILEMHGGTNDDAYMGIVPLSSNVFAGRRVAISATEVFGGLMTDANKWAYMSTNRSGNENGDGGSPQDHAMAFGLPPVDIAVGDSATVGFALVSGTTLSEMVESARLAQFIWVIVLGNPINVAVTGIEDDPLTNIPTEFSLQQNYPNPFNPTTTVRYSLKETAKVSLKIYNSLGQLVTTLVSGLQTAGFKQVVWDGTDAAGQKVASGIYLYRLEADPASGAKFIDTKKMIMLK